MFAEDGSAWDSCWYTTSRFLMASASTTTASLATCSQGFRTFSVRTVDLVCVPFGSLAMNPLLCHSEGRALLLERQAHQVVQTLLQQV